MYTFTAVFDLGAGEEINKIIQYHLMVGERRHRSTHELRGFYNRPSIFVSIYESQLREVLLYESNPDENNKTTRTYYQPITRIERGETIHRINKVYISKELLQVIQTKRKQ